MDDSREWPLLREHVLDHLRELQSSLPASLQAGDVVTGLALARDLEGSVMAIGLEEAAAIASELPILLGRPDRHATDVRALLARIRRAVEGALPPAMELPVLGARILVVDDDAVTRKVLRHVLERAGCDVVEAATAREAHAQLRKLPQAMLLDLRLPDGNGALVCAAVRRDARSRKLPVLVLTGDADAEALRESYDAGADDFLVKPVRAGDLVMRLGMLLREAGLRSMSSFTPHA